MRGALISTLIVAVSSGYLIAYIIGTFNYHKMAEFSIALVALSAGLLFFLPESPLFLVNQSQIAVNS